MPQIHRQQTSSWPYLFSYINSTPGGIVVQWEGWESLNMRHCFFKEKYKSMEDTPTEVVSMSFTRQISNKCEPVWLWEILRVPLELALHFIPRGGAQVHEPQHWLSFSRGGGAGGKTSTHPRTCSRNPDLTAQPLFMSCVCDCAHVWGRNEREGILALSWISQHCSHIKEGKI